MHPAIKYLLLLPLLWLGPPEVYALGALAEDCETVIGSWRTDLRVCQFTEITIGLPNGYRPDANDSIFYELIESRNGVSSIVERTDIIGPGEANLMPIGARYVPGASYSIRIISGDVVDGDIDLNDMCTVQTSRSVIFRTTPVVQLDGPVRIEACQGKVQSVTGRVDLPAEASGVRLTYKVATLAASGGVVSEFERNIRVNQSGAFTAYEGFLNEETLITLSRIETEYSDDNLCIVVPPVSDSSRVIINTPPVIAGLDIACENNGANYRVSFTANTQDGAQPTIFGPPGRFDGDKWTSEAISINQDYSITVIDRNNCSAPIPSRQIVCCETSIGSVNGFNNGQLQFCRSSDIVIDEKPADFNAAVGDVAVYQLIIRDVNQEERILETTGQLAPTLPAIFPSIDSYNAFDVNAIYIVRVFLGSSDGGGPAVNGAACTKTQDIFIRVSSPRPPTLQILDPATNLFTTSGNVSLPQGKRDVQFRVVGGLNQANRYFWNVDDSGGEYFDNPFGNNSYLSIDLMASPGRYTVALREKEGRDTSCSRPADLSYVITGAASEANREVYVVSTDEGNVLIVDGSEGCSYQWGFTRRNDPNRTQPEIVEGATFQAYEVDGFIPDERIYWVDTDCGGAITRHYYNRVATRVNPPRPLMRPVSVGSYVTEALGDMAIMPNPVSGPFSVRMGGFPPGPYQLVLYDPLGRVSGRREVVLSGAAPIQITWHLPAGQTSGIYFLQAQANNGQRVTRRVVVNR